MTVRARQRTTVGEMAQRRRDHSYGLVPAQVFGEGVQPGLGPVDGVVEDILTHGDEPTLRSPLADSLTLAALTLVNLPGNVVITGPGLDGELSTQLVIDRCTHVRATRLHLSHEHMDPDLSVLRLHPSEATALLAAALAGIQGTAEIRDNGASVLLTPDSAAAHMMTADACLAENPLAQALRCTASLDEAEQITISICGMSELAYERRKALTASRARAELVTDDELSEQINAYLPVAIDRGSDLTTFRRLTDALGLDHYDPERLRAALGAAADARLPIVWLRSATTTTRPLLP